MRFMIARSTMWRWLLWLFGATERSSFIEVTPDALDVRFGFFHQRIPRAQVRRVEVVGTPSWYQWGIGWRTNLAGGVGLIGTTRGLVRIELTEARPMFIGILVRAHQLTVSMEEPERFAAAVGRVSS
ncbi:MAG: PH domain-containing protein [Archangium sp.]|nr:PH domain-containing protein [Archangium sp.]